MATRIERIPRAESMNESDLKQEILRFVRTGHINQVGGGIFLNELEDALREAGIFANEEEISAILLELIWSRTVNIEFKKPEFNHPVIDMLLTISKAAF